MLCGVAAASHVEMVVMNSEYEKVKNEILHILEGNARARESEISRMLGISEEEVKRIIEDLERRGVIRGYRAVIDWEKAGVECVRALIEVKVSPERSTGYDTIAERIAKFTEVKTVRLVSGEYDLSVLVEGKTMRDVAYFVAEKIAPLERVRETVTHFLLKTYKEEGILYEDEKENRRLTISL